MLEIFAQISALILIALIISIVAKLLKQPLVIAYILAGILVSFFLGNLASDNHAILTFSEMGVAFLLFIVGLHLNPKVIKEVGFTSLSIGIIQMVATAAGGFLISYYLLSLSLLASIFVSIALMFSSTIIVTKIISDKRDLETLYGKISVGILIVQDFAVIILMIVLSFFGETSAQAPISITTILIALIILAVLVLASIFVLPAITRFVSKNQELLFLFSVGWCFFMASLFFNLGFTMEIGALLAGMALSVSPYHAEIASRVRPLRDFFIIIFFILLGLKVNTGNIVSMIVPALILSAFVIIFKFLIIMTSLGIFGYAKRTGFLASTALTQISEFSFIFIGIVIGIERFAISEYVRGVIILTGLITISTSTYLSIYSEELYSLFSKFLSIFEREHVREGKIGNKDYKYFLFGHNRIGFSILEAFSQVRKEEKDYLVVDFNPNIVKNLRKKGIQCVYGDAEDTELLEDLKIDKAKLVVSTIPDFEINLLILNKIRKKNEEAVVIPTARRIDDALRLYRAGADYVIMPHFLGGDYTAKIIRQNKADKKKYREERKKQIKNLKSRLEEGHEHPEMGDVERGSS